MRSFKKREIIVTITFILFFVALGCFFLLRWYSSSYADFEISYEGAISGKITGKGEFRACNQWGDSPVHPSIVLYTDNSSGAIVIDLATGTKTGSFPLSDEKIYGKNFLLEGNIIENGIEYQISGNNLISGTITLKSIPYESMDTVSGKFEASYRIRTGERLNVFGTFSFMADNGMSDC